MDVNTISTSAGKDGALPCIAQFVRILLVDHDTTSLMSLESQFEQQLYKVTTTESATTALSLFKARKNYYDIVIADLHMPEMDIYEFVHEVQRQRMNVPIILIAEDSTMDSARETLGNGVCYLFSKPPSHRDVANVWQHISRVTGEMPSLIDKTNCIDIEKHGNPCRGSSSDGAARDQKCKDLKGKMMNTDRENIKRKKNQIAEDSNSSNDTDEDGRRNSKKSRMTWTSALHEKFLLAVNILGERGTQPKTLLTLINEPGLTHRHVSSHLQKYRDRKRRSINLQKTASPVMPAVLPAAPLNNFVQGQTSGTANLNYMEARSTPQIPRSPGWLKAPNFVPYNFDGVKQNQDPFNFPGDDSVNTFINNGGVQIAQGIDLDYNSNEIPSANIGEQAQVFPQNFSHIIPASGQIPPSSHVSNGLQLPNQESAGAASGDVIPASGHWSDYLQAPNQEPAGALGHLIPVNTDLSNGLQTLNQEPAGDFGMGLYGFGNVGNMGDMNNDNFGEGITGSSQLFDRMPIANFGEQAQVFTQSFGHVIPESGPMILASGHLSSGLQVPNQELAGASGDFIPESGYFSNGLQAPNLQPAGASGHLTPASGHLSNGWQALNQEPAGDFGMGFYGYLGNMDNDNFGEGTTGSSQQFDGMTGNDDINQIIQEFEASGVNLWDLIK